MKICKTCIHFSKHQPSDWFGKCSEIIQVGHPDAKNCGGSVPRTHLAWPKKQLFDAIEFGDHFGCLHHKLAEQTAGDGKVKGC